MAKDELARPTIFSRLFRIVGILLAHSLALFFVMVVLCKVVPTYAILFEQQDVTLPVVTRRIVFFSEFCVAYYFLIYFFGMVTDLAVVFTLALAASRKNWLLSAYSHLCLLAASGVLFYVSVWLSHPVFSLVR